ncbi:MAG: LptF/LptG family permease [Lentisphaeria bacterium]|nr:LptF/LptG family permease [Lentisphaeria bacterium]
MQNDDRINYNFASRYQDLKKLPRRWFPLWTLDGYIFREFMIKYAILLTVFVLLFVLSDVYRDISDFLDAHASWRDIVTYLLYRLPGNIRFILPISMLLGCMWTMATFGKNLEVTAMRASGVSLFRCGGAIFAVGIAVTAVNIYFNEILIPKTSVEADRLFDLAADKRRHAKSLLTYKSNDGKRRWMFQLFVTGENQKNVILKTVWDENLMKILLSQPGTPEFEAAAKNILGLRYANLPELKYEKERYDAVYRTLAGRKVDFNIDEAYFDRESQEWVFVSGKFVSYDRIEETIFTASRGTMMLHNDLPFKELRIPKSIITEEPEDILNAVQEKDNLSTPVIWDILRKNPNMPERAKCIYQTVFFYRIAFPWSCFLAVFLGIPLATKNERTGSMLAIISAIALIVIYIVVAEIFLMLGKSGTLNPVLCGLAPTIAFIAAGAWKILNDRN